METFIKSFKKGRELELRLKNIDFYFYTFLLNYPILISYGNPVSIKEYLLRHDIWKKDIKLLNYDNKYERKTKIPILHDIVNDIKYTVDEENIESIKKNEFDDLIKKSSILMYRYKDRVSKKMDEFPNWRFDFSRVIMNDSKNNWNKQIKDNRFKNFEIEVEYIGNKAPDKDELTKLIDFINNVRLLFNLQTQLNKNRIYSATQLWNNPISMNLENIYHILRDYCVSEKADGERCLVYIDEKGEMSRIHKPFTLHTINSNKLKNKNSNNFGKAFSESVLDAEYIKELDLLLIFDVLIHNNQQIWRKPFKERYEIVKKWKSTKNIRIKEFYFPDSKNDIFQLSEKVYNMKYPYEIDGLIYVPININYEKSHIYKWKPVEETTIDFLIRDLKQTKTKKSICLFVNMSRRIFDSKGYKITTEYKKLFPFITNDSPQLPYYFETSPIAEFPIKMVKSVNGLEVPCYDKIPVNDNTIVEFWYDESEKEEKNRWKPYRLRLDKTADYLQLAKDGKYRGDAGPNSWRTAEENYKIIQNPVTKDMIFGKEKLPEKYYKEEKVNKKGRESEVYKFVNLVKRKLYDTYLQKGDTIMELASGRGGDLFKMLKRHPKKIIMVEVDEGAIKEAQKRWDDMSNSNKGNTEIEFIQMDLLKPDIKKLEKVVAKNSVNVIGCQFAFHYFMKDADSINNILEIIRTFLKKDGYFFYTSYDGEIFFNEIKNKDKLIYHDKYGEILAEIDKKYKDKTFKNYGQEIDVYVEKIGLKHPEYLVNDKYIAKELGKEFKMVKNEVFNWKEWRGELGEEEKEYIELHRYMVFSRM